MPPMSKIHQHQFTNGLWLIAEPVEGAQSLAMSFLTLGGVACEPSDQQGIAGLLSEMVCRGAGDLDAKAHCDALDQLGVQRSTSPQTTHHHLGAIMISDKLPEALPLLVDMIRRPALEQAALEPTRDLALQALEALEDEPQQKVFYKLRRRHLRDPFGRSSLGVREQLEAIDIKQVKAYWRSTFVPGGSVLAFAGRFDWQVLKDQIEQLLGNWQGEWPEPVAGDEAVRGHEHINADSAQVHIGLAYDAVPEPDEGSILQRAATAVLSGGMSGRLFTQVREKRGLCYSVFASYGGHKRYGVVMGYAGTTTPRAQETLDVLVEELRGISQGVDEDEFHRAIVGMKSRLVMQGESTSARAHAIAADQYVYGHPRSLDQLTAEVDAITIARLNKFVKNNPPGKMTFVTIGPEKLKV